ncbi:DNA translocase FtsK 4TM domain-containing protein, partial [uncultured Sphingomonas sp.]|uniref:DNA translocase FtsK 4TM domain-containing protein n=1 Tax=uncultured Sphingomonas sp. TaxID=158754 RepID=UPI0035CA36CE
MASQAQLGRARRDGLWRETVKAGAVRSGALVASVALFLLAVLAALALASYAPSDPAINTAGGGPARNLIGLPGAWFADLALTVFGPAVALLLPVVPIVALRLWKGLPAGDWVRMLRGSALGVALMATAFATVSDDSVLALPAGWGGVVGLGLTGAAQWATSFIGDTQAEWWTLVAFGVLSGLTGAIVWGRAVEIDWAELARRSRPTRRARLADAYAGEPGDEPLELTRRPVADRAPKPDRPAPNNAITIAERGSSPAAMPAVPKRAPVDTNAAFKLPALDLLTPAAPAPKGAVDRPALERNARLLESVLDDFHVRGQITEVRPGPVVTMYELEPAPGIKASRVIQLADDIARNMSAISARVATIPGR